MKVKLEAKPNHDFDGRDYRALVNIKAHWIEISSLKQASEVCSKFIEDHDLGGGNFTGGEVREGEKIIARVSYNGRVWEPLQFSQAKEIQI